MEFLQVAVRVLRPVVEFPKGFPRGTCLLLALPLAAPGMTLGDTTRSAMLQTITVEELILLSHLLRWWCDQMARALGFAVGDGERGVTPPSPVEPDLLDYTNNLDTD